MLATLSRRFGVTLLRRVAPRLEADAAAPPRRARASELERTWLGLGLGLGLGCSGRFDRRYGRAQPLADPIEPPPVATTTEPQATNSK